MNYITPSGRAVKAIRIYLADRGESIEALAEGSGISHSTLKRRLRGDSPFTIDELSLIAQHFGVPVPAILVSPLDVAA